MMEQQDTGTTRFTWPFREIPVSADAGWKKAEGFVHRACGKTALTHPDSNRLWGCEKCNMMTFSPAVYFKPVDELQ